MIKKLLLIFTFIPYCSFAQVMVGLSGAPELGMLNSSSQSRLGYTFGANVAKTIGYNFWLSAGVDYSKKCYYLDKNSSSYHFDYWEIPVLMHFRTGEGPGLRTNSVRNNYVGLSAFAGVSPSLVYDLKFSAPNKGTETVERSTLKHDGYTRLFNVNAGIGVYYQYSENIIFTVEPSIKYSLTPLVKNTSTHIYTMGVNVSFWYSFGFY